MRQLTIIQQLISVVHRLRLLISFCTVLCLISALTKAQVIQELGYAGKFDVIAGQQLNAAGSVTIEGNFTAPAPLDIDITVNSLFVYDQCIIDSAIQALISAKQKFSAYTSISIPVELRDTTLTSNTYKAIGNFKFGGSITLSGTESSVFVFNINDTLTFEDSTQIILSGVKPENVIFNVGGQVIIGINSFVNGIILATGSIICNHDLNGTESLLSQTTIQLNVAGTVGLSIVTNPDFSPILGFSFGMLSGEDITAVNAIGIGGNAGAMGSISGNITATGNIYSIASCIVQKQLLEFSTFANNVSFSSVDSIYQSLQEVYVPPGFYELKAGLNMNGTVHLTGGINDVYIFRVKDSLVAKSSCNIDYGSVEPENIFWVILPGVNGPGNMRVKQNSNFSGNIIAHNKITYHTSNSGRTSHSTLKGRIVGSGPVDNSNPPKIGSRTPPSHKCWRLLTKNGPFGNTIIEKICDPEFDISIIITAPDTIKFCKDTLIEVLVKNLSLFRIDSLYAKVLLDPHITYIAGTVNNANEFDITNLQAPVFWIDTFPKSSDTVITFRIKAICHPNLSSAAIINTFEFSASTRMLNPSLPIWSFVDTTLHFITTHKYTFPYLSIQSITPDPFEGDSAESFCRLITIINTGNSPLCSGFFFQDIYDNLLSVDTIFINGTQFTHTLVVGSKKDTVRVNIDQADWLSLIPGGLLPNDSIIIRECLTIRGCPQDVISQITVIPKCEGEVCVGDHESITYTNGHKPQPAKLKVTLSEVTDICYGAANKTKFKWTITNTGGTTASDIQLDMKRSGSTPTTFASDSFILAVSGSSSLIFPDSIESVPTDSHSLCIGSNMIDRILLDLPEIKPDSTITITFDAITCCPAEGCSSPHRWAWDYEFYYYRVCAGRDSLCLLQKYCKITSANWGDVSWSYNGVFDLEDSVDYLFPFQVLHEQGDPYWPGDTSSQLKVTVTLSQPGLSYTDWLNVDTSIYLDTVGGQLLPDSIVFSNDSTLCAYFKFFRGFELGDQFFIRIMTNCPSTPRNTVTLNWHYIPSNLCSPICKIPISCFTQQVQIHCPGCEKQGPLNTHYDIERINYGLIDSICDGIADTSLVASAALAATEFAMVGDVLEGFHTAIFNVNANYHPWPMPDSFRYLYFETSIACGNPTYPIVEPLTPIGANVSIFENATGIWHPFFLPLSLIGPSYLDPTLLLYDLSLDLLHSKGLISTNYTAFRDQDSIIIKPLYQVTENVGTFCSYIPQCIINNRLYGGRDAFPTCDNAYCEPDSITGFVTLCDTSIDKSQCDSSVIYFCEFYGDFFSPVGYEAAVNSWEILQTDSVCCNYQFNVDARFYIGEEPGCTKNTFANEFRHWAIVDTMYVVIPTEFSFCDATLTQTSSTCVDSSTIDVQIPITAIATYSTSRGDSILFTIASYYGDSTSPQSDSLFKGTDDFSLILTVNTSTSCDVDTVTTLPWYAGATFDFEDWVLADSSLPVAAKRIGNLVTIIPPDLEISAFSKNPIPAISQPACWDLKLENHNTGSVASNVWIGWQSPNGTITPFQIIDVTNANTLTVNNDLFVMNTPLKGNAFVDLQLCADYICLPDSIEFDTLILYVGWDCPKAPDSLLKNTCKIDTYYLYIFQQKPLLTATVNFPGSIKVCDTIPYEIIIHNVGDANAYEMQLTMIIPSSGGITYLSGNSQIEYPHGSGFTSINDPDIAGDTLRWLIDTLNTYIETNGLPGSLFKIDPNDRTLTLQMLLESNCSIMPWDKVELFLTALDGCGDTVIFNNSGPSFTPVITDLPPVVDLTLQMKVDGFAACDTTLLDTITICNFDSIATDTSYVFRFIPSAGIKFKSFTALNNAPGPTPIIDGDTLTWSLPLLAVDSCSSFVLELVLKNSILPSYLLTGFVSAIDSIFCATTNDTCEIEIPIGSPLTKQITPPLLPIAAFAVADTICQLDTMTLTGGCGTHFWDFGDGSTSTDSIVSHVYLVDSTYTITHIVSIGNLYSDTATHIITVMDTVWCCIYDDPPAVETGFVVTVNTTWNTDRKFIGIVTVSAGISLTIQNATIMFADTSSGIVVEPGGELDVINSTLTSACYQPWKGIEVILQNLDVQVDITIRDNSLIENALTGIRFIQVRCPPPPSVCSTIPGPVITYSSKIIISNSTFKQNQIGLLVHGLEYLPSNIYTYIYDHHSVIITIDNSTFEADDINLLPGITHPLLFIEALEIQGFTMTGDTLSNPAGLTGYNRPEGAIISTIPSFCQSSWYGFNIEENRFSDLQLGLEVTDRGTAPRIINSNTFLNIQEGIIKYDAIFYSGGSNCEINNNNFDNVKRGLYLQGAGTGNTNIVGNTMINIPPAPNQVCPPTPTPNCPYDHYGMYIVGTQNFYIANNTIDGSSSPIIVPPNTYGIVFENTGNQGGICFKNSFSGTDYGIQTQDNNRNLKIRCNNFAADGIQHKRKAWFTIDGYLKSQGLNCNSTENPAGNEWGDRCIQTGSQRNDIAVGLKWVGGQLVPKVSFDYTAHQELITGPPTDPDCSTPIWKTIHLERCVGLNKINSSCDNAFAGLIAPSGGADVDRYLADLDNLMDTMMTRMNNADSLKEERYYSGEYQLLENEKVNTLYVNNRDSEAVSILNVSTTIESKKMLTDIYFSGCNYTDAKNMVNLVQQMTDSIIIIDSLDAVHVSENNNFCNLMNCLIDVAEDGRTLKDLTPAELLIVIDVSNKGRPISAKAEVVLMVAEGDQFDHIIKKDTSQSSSKRGDFGEGISSNEKQNLKIYPNPAFDMIMIENLPLDYNQTADFIVYNEIGVQVMYYKISKERNIIKIQLTDLASGIYICEIKVDGVSMQKRKLSIIR
ncbi:MAG: DUF3494 domain-containing protein [Bacteroidetes bacterium]|nr:DUF3494 domain-containing protein [Bacteroidota bacterium]